MRWRGSRSLAKSAGTSCKSLRAVNNSSRFFTCWWWLLFSHSCPLQIAWTLCAVNKLLLMSLVRLPGLRPVTSVPLYCSHWCCHIDRCAALRVCISLWISDGLSQAEAERHWIRQILNLKTITKQSVAAPNEIEKQIYKKNKQNNIKPGWERLMLSQV